MDQWDTHALNCGVSFQGWKTEEEMFLKKYLYFYRIDAYYIINNDIKYMFTPKAVLIKAFLMKLSYSMAKVRF